MIAHALLLATGRLRERWLWPLGGSADGTHVGCFLALAVMRLRLMRLVRLAPRVATMLIPPFGATAVLRRLRCAAAGATGAEGAELVC